MTAARERFGVLGLLVFAMLAASALILWMGRDLGFVVDDLYYYARLVDDAGGLLRYDAISADWLLAPHNGHLQLTGKLTYEAVFALFGPNYAVLRVIEALAVVACVGLYFGLARRLAGDGFALITSILLLFLGAAWEPMLWAFDLHTTLALATGLGALYALVTRGRRADPLACLLLVISVLTIELGLAFCAGIAILLAADRDRLRRAWVVAVPLVVYGAWWIWARTFDQGEIVLSNISGWPGSAFDSLTAVAASLTGLISRDAIPQIVDPLPLAAGVAVAALLGLGLAVARRGVSATLAAAATTLLAYWTLIALADRPPDSSRYMLTGAVLALLVAAAAAGPVLRSRWVLAGVAAIAAIAIPFNLAKLADGRAAHLAEANANRTHYAMLELARDEVDPGYAPWRDPTVQQANVGVLVGLGAGDYFSAADRFGSIAFTPAELRAQDEAYRRLADVTLAQALGLQLERGPRPRARTGCRTVKGGDPGFGSAAILPSGGAVLRAPAGASPRLGLARFGESAPSVSMGAVRAGAWSALTIPPDAATDPWLAFASGPLRVCGAG